MPMSNDALDRLRRLREEIHTASSENTSELWSHVEGLDIDLLSDPRCSEEERQLVAQLQSGVSDIIGALNESKTPYTHSTLVAISALESSLKRRTTGEDGWPLA